MTTLETSRLISRPWEEADIDDFSAMCSDPEVMELVGGTLTPAVAATVVEKAIKLQDGFGIWIQPLILKETGDFIGITGLAKVTFNAPFAPAVEIGWRLIRAHWGCGYVTEMAREHLRHGFEQMGLEEVVAFTVPQNARSRAVMQRLGMRHDPRRDFDHPRVGDAFAHLRHHVLYALNQKTWQASASSPPAQDR